MPRKLNELKELADEKFIEFVQQDFMDTMTSREITIYMALIASKAAAYAADEENF